MIMINVSNLRSIDRRPVHRKISQVRSYRSFLRILLSIAMLSRERRHLYIELGSWMQPQSYITVLWSSAPSLARSLPSQAQIYTLRRRWAGTAAHSSRRMRSWLVMVRWVTKHKIKHEGGMRRQVEINHKRWQHSLYAHAHTHMV